MQLFRMKTWVALNGSLRKGGQKEKDYGERRSACDLRTFTHRFNRLWGTIS